MNLEPGFQRKSVWKESDRKKLIDSIFRNYALPAIYLYERIDGKKIVYDVIDGKQRIESIFLYMGVLPGKKRFDANLQLPNMDKPEKVSWGRLQKRKLDYVMLNYPIYAIIIKSDTGNINSIIDLFIRINSTGKQLVSAEKQNAQYNTSKLLIGANALAKKFEDHLLKNLILSASQIERMKHVELMCEFLISILKDDLLNKKSAINIIMGKDNYELTEINEAKRKVIRAINRANTMFPDIKTTRFKKLSDYYILVFLIAKFENEGLVLIDKKRNELAWNWLVQFGAGVDKVRDNSKKNQNHDPSDDMFIKYSRTVSEATDEINHRRERLKILDGLLRNLFESEDRKRTFSDEQRRLLWHSSEQKRCTFPGCKKILTWEDFTIDHINAHSRGGKAELNNAALMCRPHNSMKGNR